MRISISLVNIQGVMQIDLIRKRVVNDSIIFVIGSSS